MIFDEYISFGSQCNPGLSLRELNCKTQTYPFDWIRSNSKIIYDVLKNGPKNYLEFDNNILDDYYCKDIDIIDLPNYSKSYINSYGQYFTHYTHITTTELIVKFQKYFDRLYLLLNSNKNVLFIHTHEEYIYNKKSRDNKDEFYEYLCKINDLLLENYPNLKFTILNLDVNNTHNNYKNIINLNIFYNLQISNNNETHTHEYYQPYRDETTKIIKNYIDTNINMEVGKYTYGADGINLSHFGDKNKSKLIIGKYCSIAVSYTHLTLPTILRV